MNFTQSKALTGLLLLALSAAGVSAQVSNFDSLNGYAAGVDTRLALSRGYLLRNPAAGATSNLFVNGSYTSRDVDAATDSMERSTDAQSFMVGYNWRLEGWSFGVGLVAESTSSDYVELNSPAPQPLRGSVDGDSFKGVVWAGFKLGQVDVGLHATAGSTSNDGVRRSDAGTSRAEFDSQDFSIGLRLSYTTQLSDTVVLEPFFGLNFASADSDGFAEQGTAPDRRILRDFKMRDDRIAAGVTISGKSGDWVPTATIAWLHRISDDGTTISSTASNGLNLGAGFAPSASDGVFLIGAGISGKLADRWRFDGTVDYSNGGDEEQFTLNLGVRREF